MQQSHVEPAISNTRYGFPFLWCRILSVHSRAAEGALFGLMSKETQGKQPPLWGAPPEKSQRASNMGAVFESTLFGTLSKRNPREKKNTFWVPPF